MQELYKTLKTFGRVKTNQPMSKYTTFKIGGPAKFLVVVEQTDQLVELLRFLDGEGIDHFLLGGGSNMLVQDEAYEGVVVQVVSKNVSVLPDGIVADAGCSTVAISNLSIKEGFTGFEWGIGVPGTIGGALRGNAGAMGGEMKDVVLSAEVYQNGEVVTLNNEACDFGYRHSICKDEPIVVLRVRLQLERGADKEGMKQALQYLAYRNQTQPKGYASTGCIFKNLEIGSDFVFPASDMPVPKEFLERGKVSAGWLIDQAGLKGTKVGNAQVSAEHGNFIINLGGATATEVLTLIEQIKERVYNTFGVSLEEEIQII